MDKFNNIKRNILIIIFLSVVINFWMLKDDFHGILDKIININLTYFLLALLCLFLYILFMGLSLKKLARKFNRKFTLKEALYSSTIINFISSITPANAGAPAAAIYTLKANGLKTKEATHIGVLYLTIYKISFLILATFAILSNFFFDHLQGDSISGWFVTLSYWITAGLMIGLLLISYNGKLNKWVFSKGIKILAKLKIVKDKQKTIDIWDNYIDEFILAGQELKSDRVRMLLSIVYYLIALIFFMIIPYFAIKAVVPSMQLYFGTSFVISIYVCLIATVTPIPGSSGGTEMAFWFFYIKMIPINSVITTSLLIYRLLTYYLIVIIGGISLLKFENKTKNIY